MVILNDIYSSHIFSFEKTYIHIFLSALLKTFLFFKRKYCLYTYFNAPTMLYPIFAYFIIIDITFSSNKIFEKKNEQLPADYFSCKR